MAGTTFFSPRTLLSTLDSPFSKVMMGFSPRASPIKAAAADTRPDFLANRRSRGTNRMRAWASQSRIKASTFSGDWPSAAILAPWTTAQP